MIEERNTESASAVELSKNARSPDRFMAIREGKREGPKDANTSSALVFIIYFDLFAYNCINFTSRVFST